MRIKGFEPIQLKARNLQSRPDRHPWSILKINIAYRLCTLSIILSSVRFTVYTYPHNSRNLIRITISELFLSYIWAFCRNRTNLYCLQCNYNNHYTKKALSRYQPLSCRLSFVRFGSIIAIRWWLSPLSWGQFLIEAATIHFILLNLDIYVSNT